MPSAIAGEGGRWEKGVGGEGEHGLFCLKGCSREASLGSGIICDGIRGSRVTVAIADRHGAKFNDIRDSRIPSAAAGLSAKSDWLYQRASEVAFHLSRAARGWIELSELDAKANRRRRIIFNSTLDSAG